MERNYQQLESGSKPLWLPHLSGIPGFYHGEYYHFNRSVLLVHVGKAGGGSVRLFMDKHNITHLFEQIHVHPVPHSAVASHLRIVVCLRDPVERLISAYNWGITRRKRWALRLARCYTVDQFAVQSAYAHINPSLALQSGREACGRLLDWNEPNIMTHGHIKRDSCFYLGGCIGDSAFAENREFVVTAEQIEFDSREMLKWMNASTVSGPSFPHSRDNSAANLTRNLSAFAREALEVALVDEYRMLNYALRISVNRRASAYCTTHAEVPGVCKVARTRST